MKTALTKVKSPAALKGLLGRRSASRPMVFTNGCFDILHRGHVTYLERARRLGTCLVVALNSDNSVRGLKGDGRPVNPLADRLLLVGALESVDYVTWFDDATPLKLILKLRPDVLVKGGDWRATKIVGGPEVLSWGGTVRSLPFVRGRSTTGLFAKIRGL